MVIVENLRKHLALITIVCLVPAAWAMEAAKPIPVDVWCGGDDGLTMRLRDAFENKFKSSPDFDFNSKTGPRTLVVKIPTNVDWKDIGKRTKVLYKVEFATADKRKIGTIKGSCWDDMLDDCAAQVLKKAKSVAHKIRSVR